MFRSILDRWADWTGDKRLSQAIQRELRRGGYAVHAAKTRRVELAAVARPGWVQVYRFGVETHWQCENPHERRAVILYGLARDDGRKSRIEIMLTEDETAWRERFTLWSDGLIVRKSRTPRGVG